MSDFLKLGNIAKRNGDIKAFSISTNFISSRSGKNGWGNITIAIDNESVQNLFMDDSIGILYIVSKDEWKKESENNL
jgi:hypothetical protein